MEGRPGNSSNSMDAPPPDDAAAPPLPRMGPPYIHLPAASPASVPAAFPGPPPTQQVLGAPPGYLPPPALPFGGSPHPAHTGFAPTQQVLGAPPGYLPPPALPFGASPHPAHTEFAHQFGRMNLFPNQPPPLEIDTSLLLDEAQMQQVLQSRQRFLFVTPPTQNMILTQQQQQQLQHGQNQLSQQNLSPFRTQQMPQVPQQQQQQQHDQSQLKAPSHQSQQNWSPFRTPQMPQVPQQQQQQQHDQSQLFMQHSLGIQNAQMRPGAVSGQQQPGPGIPSLTDSIASGDQRVLQQVQQSSSTFGTRPQVSKQRESRQESTPVTSSPVDIILTDEQRQQQQQRQKQVDAIKQAFFMDEGIMSVTFIKYIKPHAESRTLQEIYVPGNSRKHVTRSPQVRRGTSALVKWAIALYNAGYYLDGRFTSDDFGVDLFGNLKGKLCLTDLLKKVTVEEAKEILKNKMSCVADIVEEIHSSVDSKLEVPYDLNHLLLLLRQEDISCPLIVHHASHDEEDIQSALFVTMYKSLMAMEESDPTTYISIIEGIPDVMGWVRKAMQNCYMHAALRFKQLEVAPTTVEQIMIHFFCCTVRYCEDVNGLLDFRRNGDAHLLIDSSVDTVGYTEAGLYAASEGFNAYYQQEQEKMQLKQEQETQNVHTWQNDQKQRQKETHERIQKSQRTLKQLEIVQGVHKMQHEDMERSHNEYWNSMKERHQSDQEDLLRKPLPYPIAESIVTAVCNFLTVAQNQKLSMPAAMAGARAAAVYAATVNLTDPSVQASVEASAASQLAAATPVPGDLPWISFTSKHITHMHDMVAPKLLVHLQELMFQKGQTFRLGQDSKVPKLE